MFVKSQFFKIQGEENLQKISDFVREYHQQAHESNYVGGFLRVYEDYSFFMGNDLVVCIRVDLNEVENNIDEESGNCPIYYSKNNKSSDEKTGKNVKDVDKLGELNKISEVDYSAFIV